MTRKFDRVHCFFEQSGTFKNAWKRLGVPAEDYDIQNNFGETDHVVDLFGEIEAGFRNEPSVFDRIGGGDLIMAFFPCIYFEAMQQSTYSFDSNNLRGLGMQEKYETVIDRIRKREYFLVMLYKLCCIAEVRGLKMIVENPATPPHYLLFPQNFVKKPDLIDRNRALRGDYFRKPTAYWYFGLTPTYGESYKVNPNPKRVNDCANSRQAGICSEERSLISPEYARNFICDFVLGTPNENTQQTLFDNNFFIE